MLKLIRIALALLWKFNVTVGWGFITTIVPYIMFSVKFFITWYVRVTAVLVRLLVSSIVYIVKTPTSLFIWTWKNVFGHRSSEKLIQQETRRRCVTYINPMGSEETLDSLPQVYPQLHVVEDYYVKDSTYLNGDCTRNKYENSKRITIEDMIGKENKIPPLVSGLINEFCTYQEFVPDVYVLEKCEFSKSDFQVLIGPPGSGKTVLAKRIAKRSIEKGLRTWLLNLEDYHENDYLSIDDLLINRYLGDNTDVKVFYTDQEDKWIRCNQNKCLIVMDGLDKATFPLNYMGANQILGRDAKLPPSKLFSLLCSRHFLPGVRLILVSRPHSIISFSPLIRPNRVVFVNDLLEGDVEAIMDNNKSDDLYESLKRLQPRSFQFARNPLFLHIIMSMSDQMNYLQPAPFLMTMLKQYKASKHYTTNTFGKRIDMVSVEKVLSRLAWKKTMKGYPHIRCSDLLKYHLGIEEVQNVLFPAIENYGNDWYRLADDMLSFHFVQAAFEELLCVTHVMGKETEAYDEFKETVDHLLIRHSGVRVGNDNLTSLQNTLCEYINSPMFQGTDHMRDHYLHAFIERITEDVQKVFGPKSQSHEEEVTKMIKIVTQITDEKIIIRIQNKLAKFEFHFEFLTRLDDTTKHNVCEMFQTVVTKIEGLRLNCKGYVECEVDELLQSLQAVEQIEHLYLERIKKLSPRTLECIFKEILPRVSKNFTLEIYDMHDFETLKKRVENYDCSRLEHKELTVKLYGEGNKKYKTTLTQPMSFMRKVPKTNDDATNMDIFEQIKLGVANEAKQMLKQLDCDIDGSVLPEMKFVYDFAVDKIFERQEDESVYDMEFYPNSKVIDAIEIFINLHSRRRVSLCLCGAKGSGKTILANVIIAQMSSDDKWTILINLDYLNKDKTTCLKEVLIDNFASKHGVFDNEECENAFQRIIENPGACNIILDNYDRASFELTTSSSLDVNEKMKPEELFGNLFAKRLLPEANVLLISRPYALTQLPLKLRPKSLFFVGNLSDENVSILFDRFYGRKKSEVKRKYIDQNFPLAWKLCRNPQMLYILTHHIELEKKRNFFEVIDEICFQFNGEDQQSREQYCAENSKKLVYLAYKASKDSSITLVSDATSKNVHAVEGMMLVKPHGYSKKKKQSQIESHFINSLIQDHYTARFLKEVATDEEVKHFLDKLLFPEGNNIDDDDSTSDRYHLVRRFCCSNLSGRRRMDEYFWKKVKEAVEQHCECEEPTAKKEIEGLSLIMDLVEIFTEEKRRKQSTKANYYVDEGYGCTDLCDDMRKMNQTFYNVKFRTIHSIFQACKLTQFCEYVIHNANMSIEDINKEKFKQILSEIKVAQLVMCELEIQEVQNLEVSSLKELKTILNCIVSNLNLDIDDCKKAQDLYNKFSNLSGLPRLFFKTQNQGDVDITIYDAAENSYTPLKIHRRDSQMHLNPNVS